MFKLAAVKTVTWPVEVQIPQDGGKVTRARFSATFEILSTEEYEEIVNAGGDVLKRTLIGWGDDLLDEAGEAPVAFSEEAKATLLRISYVRVGLLGAYLQASAGREAARKN